MAIYSCFEMTEDCRLGKPAGWNHLIINLLPPCRLLLLHHRPATPNSEALLIQFLTALRDDPRSPIRTQEPSTERILIYHLLDFLLPLATASPAEPAPPAELEAFTEVLAPLTFFEKQAVWLEAMHYEAKAAGTMLSASPETVEQTRAKAAEALRERLPGWSIRSAGPTLDRAIRSLPFESEIPLRKYVSALDGRLTWSDRQDVERSVASSWREVDRMCRIREADLAVRSVSPLEPAEAAPFQRALGIEPPKTTFWQRVLASK